MLGNLFKAVVATALTPVAVVVDIVKIPVTSEDYRRSTFEQTEKMLESVGDNISKALK